MNREEQLNEELIRAIEYNDLEAIKSLVKNGVNVHALDYYGENILYRCVEYENLKLAKYFVGLGVNAHNLDDLGKNIRNHPLTDYIKVN